MDSELMALSVVQDSSLSDSSYSASSSSYSLPVGVLLLNEDEGVMGGVTGGVRFPLLWRGGVATLLRERLPINESDSFGWTFFFKDS